MRLEPVRVSARIAAKFLLVNIPWKGLAAVLAGTNRKPQPNADIDARVVVPGVVGQPLLHRLLVLHIFLMALRRAEFRVRAGGIHHVQTTTLFTFGDGHIPLQAEQNPVAERDAPFGVRGIVDRPGALLDSLEFTFGAPVHFVPVAWIAPAIVIVGAPFLLAAAIGAVAAGSSGLWLAYRFEANKTGIFAAHQFIIRTCVLFVK
jgi:hypothetical protein